MKINRFEDILAWQKSLELTLAIYSLFRNCKDYSFRDQIQRATVSIMNNIAEGYERNGNKEFRNFLYIAKGSCAEVRSMLTLVQELGYIKRGDFNTTNNLTIEISKMLSSFIGKL